MGMNEMERSLEVSFQHWVKNMLIAEVRSEMDVAESYYGLPVEKQREIDEEIKNRAKLVAEDIIKRLKEKGYVEREPSNAVLAGIVKRALSAHEAVE